MLVLGPGLWLWVQVAGAGTGRQGGSAGADAGQWDGALDALRGRFLRISDRGRFPAKQWRDHRDGGLRLWQALPTTPSASPWGCRRK